MERGLRRKAMMKNVTISREMRTSSDRANIRLGMALRWDVEGLKRCRYESTNRIWM